MPQIPNLIHLAIPGFILLLVLEAVAAAVMRRDLYEFKDTAASLTMGTGNVLIELLAKAAVFAIFTFIHRFAIFSIGYQWWAWLLVVFADDLSYSIAPAMSAGCSGHRTWSIILLNATTWAPRYDRPGPEASCRGSSGYGCRWLAFLL